MGVRVTGERASQFGRTAKKRQWEFIFLNENLNIRDNSVWYHK